MVQIGKAPLQSLFETYHNLHEISKEIWAQRKKRWKGLYRGCDGAWGCRLWTWSTSWRSQDALVFWPCSLPQQSPPAQEKLLTLKIIKSLLFFCKTGACLFRGTEAPVKNFHNHIFSLTAFMRMQKGLPFQAWRDLQNSIDKDSPLT